ncbi:DUF7344 domain-containing protein [Halomarina pelagica]|uniref:DUF7344 domain-containing protein n=1 Tax=Halomarina pelagica TaxID=2961599 RepID=UPI0020C32FA6|nr:hypothetical protein [Halomarina sp. BND7]
MSGVPGSRSEARTVERALSVDAIFELLGDRRRRRVLTYLDRYERRVDLNDLAESLTDDRNGPTAGRFALTLHHTHLPKLDDAGVVTYDPTDRIVEREPVADRLRPYLMLARADDRGDVVTGQR